MKILIFDFETNDKDPAKAVPIELGYIVYDSSYDSIIEMHSCLVEYNEILLKKISDLTGIHNDQVKIEYDDSVLTMKLMTELIFTKYYSVDTICGHNVRNYDLPILKRLFESFSLKSSYEPLTIDTMTDLPLPENMGPRRDLMTLGAYHGFLNPFPHRALADCMSTMKLLLSYPIVESVKLAREKLITLVVCDNIESDEARENGYYWNPKVFAFSKDLKESRVIRERDRVMFEVCELENMRCYKALVKYDEKEKVKAAKFLWNPDKKIWFKFCPVKPLEDLEEKFGFKVEEILWF